MSVGYDAMTAEMEKGTYTEIEAKNAITVMYAKKMLSEDQYNALMDIATELSANTSDGELNNRLVAIEESVAALKTELEAVKQAIEEGGTVVPEPEPEADGSEFNPITAYAGMMYVPGKYYKDPNDGQVYKMRDDRADVPPEGLRLDYVPSQLVNIYFYFVRTS